MSGKLVQNFRTMERIVTIRYPVTSLDLANPRISKIYVSPGDRIAKDALLVGIETSKAVFDISSNHGGTVMYVAVKEGQLVFEDEDLVTILKD